MSNDTPNPPLLRTGAVTVAPGAQVTVPIAGEWFEMYEGTQNIFVSVDQSPQFLLYVREVVSCKFQQITFNNTSTSDTLNIKYRIGVNGFKPIQQNGFPIAAILSARGDVACGAAAQTQIISGASFFKRTWISNSGAAAVRIGGASVSNLAGIFLQPNTMMKLDGAQDIYCYNPSGASVNINITVEET